MNPIVPLEVMQQHKVLLQNVFNDFNESYVSYARKQKGFISNHGVDNLMNKTVVKYQDKISAEELQVVQGFFDTYMGLSLCFQDSGLLNMYLKENIFN